MWKIEKSFRFEASHRLPFHAGKCARLHGHSWRGICVCEGDTLNVEGPQRGMLIDFGTIGQVVNELVDRYLDHHHLNDSTGLENPTCEEVSRWIYEKLLPEIPLLAAVIIEETCTSRCEYRPSNRQRRRGATAN
jgi:6-pyruvoyltetrahydropterin/6-carboxytetrahydropterin synthase